MQIVDKREERVYALWQTRLQIWKILLLQDYLEEEEEDLGEEWIAVGVFYVKKRKMQCWYSTACSQG